MNYDFIFIIGFFVILLYVCLFITIAYFNNKIDELRILIEDTQLDIDLLISNSNNRRDENEKD